MLSVLAWLDQLQLWQLGLVLVAIFWVAAYAGRLLHRERPEGSGDAGYIVSASLGLLALLLGFTVSMAVQRYDGRRAATVAEANAIGTFLYRTDLMPADVRARTQAALRDYLEARIRVGQMGEDAASVANAKQVTARASKELWQDVLAVRTAIPDPAVQLLVVESANAMFDGASARDAALANRLPPTLVALLLLFPIASLFLIGYISGKSLGIHLMASTELILLLTLVLLLIADLNSPRSGTIRTPLAPLIAVKEQADATASLPAPPAPLS